MGIQSALHPAGTDAALIAEITWILFAGGAVIFVLVMALAAWAVLKPPPWLARRSAIVAGGIAFPAVVLVLLVYTLIRADALSVGEPAVRVEVTGHQWWWHITYLRAPRDPARCGRRRQGRPAARAHREPRLSRRPHRQYAGQPRALVRHPQAVDPRTAMPDMQVTEAHARDMVAYLYTLK